MNAIAAPDPALKVLIVEDNENDFIIARDLLMEAPPLAFSSIPEVQWAPDYEDGIARLREQKFDVALVDYSLPPRNGLEFLDEALKSGNRIPVILLTGSVDYKLDLEAMRCGASDFLDKGSLTARNLERSIRYAVERRRNVDELEIAEAENSRILQSAHCILMTCTVIEHDGRYDWAVVARNEAVAQEIVALNIEAGSNYAEALNRATLPGDRAAANAVAAEAVRAGRSGYQVEYRVKDRFGKVIWLSDDSRIEPDGVRRWRVTSVCLDITEHKQQIEAVRQAELQMTAIVEHAMDAIVVMDASGTIVEFNPAAEEMFLYLREHAVGQALGQLIIPEHRRTAHSRGLARFLETGQSHIVNHRSELMALRADGSEFPAELAITVVRLAQETLFIGFVRDVTDRLKAEAEILSQARHLEEERARLVYAQELAGVGSWSFDVKTQSLSLSDELFRIAGRERSDSTTSWETLLNCVHPEDRELVISGELLKEGDPRPFIDEDVRIIRPSGETRYMQCRTRAIHNRDGERVRIEGTMADITDRKMAEHKLESFFAMSLDLLAIGSSNGRFERINSAFETTLGFTVEELLAEPFLNFVHPEDVDATVEQFAALQRGTPVHRFINRCRRRDGTYRWLLWMITPFGDQFYAVAHDITALREADETLRRANAALETRVAERTAALVEAKHVAERANRAKSDFLSRMSHEFRTPLNAILGFGQILMRRQLPESDQESLGDILKAGRHLLNLVNDILDLARAESGHVDVTIEPVELGVVVRECVQLTHSLAIEQNIDVRTVGNYDELPFVLADSRRLRQVLLNLISNGIKYNREDGKVEISARVLGGQVYIDVSDTGNGIAREDLHRLFTPFERLNAAKSQVEGTGLGLSLSRQLAALMGGGIEVDSVVGQGSTFTISLPIADSTELTSFLAGHEKSWTPTERIGLSMRKVLYIEDNLSNIRLFKKALEDRSDITLITANRGATGLDIAFRELPDVLVVDVNLPDVSGKSIIEEIRRSGRFRSVPIIAVSADATPHQIDTVLKAGADVYLTKPIDLNELFEALDHALAA